MVGVKVIGVFTVVLCVGFILAVPDGVMIPVVACLAASVMVTSGGMLQVC
jgi:hypothetical protein